MALRFLPVYLSYLLLAAHFFREANLFLVLISLALPFLLLVPVAWTARLVQVGLVLGFLEWMWTLFAIAQRRQMMGDAWVRMAVILGAVALFTLLSALVFRSKRVRERYFSGD